MQLVITLFAKYSKYPYFNKFTSRNIMQIVVTLLPKHSKGPYFELNHCHKSYKKRKICRYKTVIMLCMWNILQTIYIAQYIIGIMNQPLLCAFRELIKSICLREMRELKQPAWGAKSLPAAQYNVQWLAYFLLLTISVTLTQTSDTCEYSY